MIQQWICCTSAWAKRGQPSHLRLVFRQLYCNILRRNYSDHLIGMCKNILCCKEKAVTARLCNGTRLLNVQIYTIVPIVSEIKNEYLKRWVYSCHTHNFDFKYHGTSTHFQSLNYSSYSYLIIRMMLMIPIRYQQWVFKKMSKIELYS